jgi:hypothetical protein
VRGNGVTGELGKAAPQDLDREPWGFVPGRRCRDPNDWKGLEGVRAGRVGGTDRAPNHINLSGRG